MTGEEGAGIVPAPCRAISQSFAGVAQSARAGVSYAPGRGFDSLLRHHVVPTFFSGRRGSFVSKVMFHRIDGAAMLGGKGPNGAARRTASRTFSSNSGTPLRARHAHVSTWPSL